MSRPATASVRVTLSRVLIHLGEREEARRQLERALAVQETCRAHGYPRTS